ncbi:GAF domain-containing protein [Prauserella halophila]|uniref:GAF domain-containing protein n=1 Tax=Prauserella halophila TaxID=185641 RepID=A0ABN1WGQ7_9PSEU|nr:GAF domain-containing protein [Prauserella halophila]MCP2238236.1 Sugar diacid utilization regulator [Prauserella halophila]
MPIPEEARDSTEDLLEEYQRRTRELAALFDTAGDLSSIRDVDEVLAAIVRRSRQLLASDTAYLMLIDRERSDTFMRVSDGTQTPEFMSIRLAYGEGLGGLVATTGSPQWTSDYQSDPRFAESIVPVVRAEALEAILGVPLKIGTMVIGVLFAADRSPRVYQHSEVALLSSLASHAAIALENASLFQETQQAVVRLEKANAQIEEHNRMLERAADLHERLTELVATGASIIELAEAVATGIGGSVLVTDATGAPLTPLENAPSPPDPAVLAEISDRSVAVPQAEVGPLRIAPVHAGTTRLGFVVFAGRQLDDDDVRALESAAMVTALLLTDLRAHEEARSRLAGELFAEIASHPETEQRIRARAAASGLALADPPYSVAVAIEADYAEASSQPPRSALGKDLTGIALDRAGLAQVTASHVAVILPSADSAQLADDLATQLTETAGKPITIGAVGPFDTLADASAGLSRALNCAKILMRIGRQGTGATPEQLGMYTLLFSDTGRGQIEEFVWEVIGPVLSDDTGREGSLARTLEAYLECGAQPGQAAKELFIHVNTLYKRLERVDRLLGAGWRRGEQLLQVHLALRLATLLETME